MRLSWNRSAVLTPLLKTLQIGLWQVREIMIVTTAEAPVTMNTAVNQERFDAL